MEIITAYTTDDEQCIVNSYPRLSIKELADELNMTERTIKHILQINGKLKQKPHAEG